MDDIYIDRLPPHDLEAESAVLGSCLLDPECYGRLAGRLRQDDFYLERHRAIWRAMGSLHERREAIDLLTLRAELDKAGCLQEVGGPAYLAGLSADLPTALHAQHYAGIVGRTAMLRRMIDAAGQIAALGYDRQADVDTVLARAEQALLEVRRSQPAVKVITPAERASRAADWLDALRQGVRPGIPFGLRDLDEMTGGAQPGQLIIVGGRPGTGKSTLLQTMASAMGQSGNKVLFASVEMREQDISKRELAWTTKINLHRIVTGEFSEEEFGQLFDALGPLSESSVYVYDSCDMTTSTLRAAATEMQMRWGLDALYIDYLQILADQPHGSNDVGRVSYISRQLLNLARVLNVPVIAASQLSRKSEEREGEMPRLSDLRESGALEQDAHLVLLIHRQKESTNRARGLPDPTELIVAKQRQGPVGTLMLRFMPRQTRFVDA